MALASLLNSINVRLHCLTPTISEMVVEKVIEFTSKKNSCFYTIS